MLRVGSLMSATNTAQSCTDPHGKRCPSLARQATVLELTQSVSRLLRRAISAETLGEFRYR
jgi:hypothetical protein